MRGAAIHDLRGWCLAALVLLVCLIIVQIERHSTRGGSADKVERW